MPQQPPDVSAPPTPPEPPQAPALPTQAPPAPGMVVYAPALPVGQPLAGQPLAGVPRTTREMRALRRQRSELSSQLTNVTERRSELVQQLERTDPDARDGMRQRIALLDQRILQIEGELARTGQLVVAAPADLSTSTTEPPQFFFGPGGLTYTNAGLIVMLALAVLLPITIAATRMLWRRGSAAPAGGGLTTADSQRLLRLEQAIDTIAIEVERVSEGQRYVTQLLADGTHQRMLEGAPGAGRQR